MGVFVGAGLAGAAIKLGYGSDSSRLGSDPEPQLFLLFRALPAGVFPSANGLHRRARPF